MKILILVLLLPVFAAAQTTMPSGMKKKTAKKWVQYEEKLTNKANAGDALSIEQLAHLYGKEQSWVNPHDLFYSPEKEKYWLQQGVKLGVGSCAFQLANVYSHSANYADSASFYFQFSADRGYVPAMLHLANEYDYRDMYAIYWYRQAAAKGNAEAAQEVADIITGMDNPFAKGNAAYKNNNMDLAMQLWKVDYKINKNANAAFNVGILYQQKGRTVDWSYAVDWFDNACRLGMVEGCMIAAKLCNDEGQRGMAMDRWEKAVALGNTVAAGYINKTNSDIVAEQAQKDAYWSAYNKKVNDAINNGTYVNPNAVSSSSKPAIINYYALPKKTAAENDQAMYEKMHREQAQREKAYKDKWGN